MLIVVALLTPFSRLATTPLGPVVRGTAVIVFSIIRVIGIDLIRRVYQHASASQLRASVAVSFLLGELMSLALLMNAGQIDGPQCRARIGGRGMLISVLAFAAVSRLFVIARHGAADWGCVLSLPVCFRGHPDHSEEEAKVDEQR